MPGVHTVNRMSCDDDLVMIMMREKKQEMKYLTVQLSFHQKHPMKPSIQKYEKLIGYLFGPLCYMHDSLVLHINRRVLIDLTNTQLQTIKEKIHFTALKIC